jgi:hypothetical protein
LFSIEGVKTRRSIQVMAEQQAAKPQGENYETHLDLDSDLDILRHRL